MKTFTYPYVQDGLHSLSAVEIRSSQATAFTPVEQNEYSDNMSIIAIVKCGGLLFLTVLGETNGETINFHVYDAGQTITATQTLPYAVDAVVGTIASPYVIQLDPEFDGLEGVTIDNLQITIYPNPVTDELFINSRANTDGKADATLAASIFHFREIGIPALKDFWREKRLRLGKLYNYKNQSSFLFIQIKSCNLALSLKEKIWLQQSRKCPSAYRILNICVQAVFCM